MIEFAVSVQGQRITCTKVKGELVSGAKGAKVRFTWSEEWQQLQRIGVFRAGSIARDVMDLQEECVIPWEVLVEPGPVLMIGVQGINEEGTAVTPTLEAEMDEILRGADPSDDPSTEPTLPIWQWVKNLLEQVIKKFTDHFQRIEEVEVQVNENEGEITALQDRITKTDGLVDSAFVGGGDTLKWDGNTEGRVIAAVSGGNSNWSCQYARICNAVPTMADIPDENFTGYVIIDGMPMDVQIYRNQIVETVPGAVIYEDSWSYFALVSAEAVGKEIAVDHIFGDSAKVTFPETGTYFFYKDSKNYASHLAIPGYTGFGRKLDTELLPDSTEQDAAAADDLAAIASRLEKIDGIVTLPTFERGVIWVGESELQYNDEPNSTRAIRTPENVFIHLNAGDRISMRNALNYSPYVIGTFGGFAYEQRGDLQDTDGDGALDGFIIPADGDYAIAIYGDFSNESVDEVLVNSGLTIRKGSGCLANIILPGDTLTWDGNTDGRTVVEWTSLGTPCEDVHISDVVLTLDDIPDGGSVLIAETYKDGSSGHYEIQKTECYEQQGVFVFGNVTSVPLDAVGKEISWGDGTVIFPKAGTYFYVQSTDYYASSITIPGYTGFGRMLKPELLPESVATKADLAAAIGSAITASY